MKNKRCVRAVLLLLCSLLLVSCAPKPEKDEGQNEMGQETYVVGVSILDLTNPYYVESVRGMRDEAAKHNIKLIVEDPRSDAYVQYEQVKEFINQKVQAIVIAALSPDVIDPLLLEARSAGIKVIAHSTKVKNCDVHLTADEWEMGYTLGIQAGKWITEKMNGQAQIAILDYPRIPQIVNRVKGMKDALQELAPGATVVVQRSASRPEEGFKAMMEILKEYPDIQVVLCINDGGALGAFDALEKSGKIVETTFVGGCDATPEALEKINAGTAYRCSVDIYPYLTGQMDINFFVRLMRGEVIPERYAIPTQIIVKPS